MTSIARLLSWLFHPIFMPLATLVVALRVDPKLSYFIEEEFLWINYLLIAVLTIGFPVVSIALLRRSNVISSMEMPHKEERIIPFALTLFYYGLTYYMLRQIQLDTTIYSMFLGAMLALFLALMITRTWKISIHMVGIGGLLGAVLALTTYHYPMDALILLCSIILIAGGLASARLWLGAHTKGQVYAGFAVGFCSVFLNIVLGIWI